MRNVTNIRKLSVIQSGFTLIELLIVIAVIGVLAAVVLVAIDPLEQLKRARDTGRLDTVSQLGKAAQSYFTFQGSWFPNTTANWLTFLQTAGELKIIPTNPDATITCWCTGGGCTNQNQICYQTDTVNAVVYMRTESKSYRTKFGCPHPNVFVVWNSAYGKTGLWCDPVSGGNAPTTTAIPQ